MAVQNSLAQNVVDVSNKTVEYECNGQMVKLSPNIIKQYLVSGNGRVTDQEVVMFLNLCKFQKLNPFLREAYLIKFGSQPATIVTGKEKSNLFYHFVRALKECKPKWFLLENVASMEQKWADVISNELGVKPIMINSALVCAAERKRLYWTNIPDVEQPEDKGVVLKDIAEPAEQVPQKYWYTKYPFTVHDGDVKVKATIHLNGHRQTKEVYGLNHKSNTLLCDGSGGNLVKKSINVKELES